MVVVIVFVVRGAVLGGPGGLGAHGVVRGEFFVEGVVAAGGSAGGGGVLGHDESELPRYMYPM